MKYGDRPIIKLQFQGGGTNKFYNRTIQLIFFKPGSRGPKALSITEIRRVFMLRIAGHEMFVFEILEFCLFEGTEINLNLSILVFDWTVAQSFKTTMISLFANLDYLD